MTLCWWTLGSERHRYVITWLDKLGADPVAVGGIYIYVDAVTGSRRNPVSKHH